MVKLNNVKSVVYFWIIYTILFFLALLSITGGHAQESAVKLTTFWVYTVIMFMCMGIITIDQLFSDRKYLKFIGSYLHNPDDAIIFNLIKFIKEKYLASGKRLFLSFMGLSFVSSMVAVYRNTFIFVGTNSIVAGQIFPLAGLYISGYPPFGEVLVLAVILGTIRNTIKYLTNNNKVVLTFVMLFSIPLIGFLFFGYFFHSAVYGADQFSRTGSGFLGMIYTTLMVFTGSVIPSLIFGFFNDFFYEANDLYSDQAVILITISVFIGFIFIAILSWRIKKRRANATQSA